MMEAWFSSSESTASSGPNKTWHDDILFMLLLFLMFGVVFLRYLKQPSISIETAGIEDAILPLVEFRKLLLKIFVDILKTAILNTLKIFNHNTYKEP